MKSTIYKGTVSVLLFALLMSSPFPIQAQVDPNAIIDLPAGGSIDLPMDIPMEGGVDLPVGEEVDFSGGEGLLDGDIQVENDPGDPGQDPGVPVDGGLGFLLAAGLGYGANRLRKYKQEKRKTDK